MKRTPLITTFRRHLMVARPSAPGRLSHVAAASGLAWVNHVIWVAPDDELHLAHFDALNDAAPGELVRIFPGVLPDDKKSRKKCKPDLEALVLLPLGANGTLLALPSGSKPNRTRGAMLPLNARGAGESSGGGIAVDVAALYGSLDKAHDIGRLNIEGAVVAGTFLRLFQRGNSKAASDAVVDLDLATVLRSLSERWTIEADAIRTVTKYDLGDLNGIPLTFTDATAVADDLILFSAAAEATDDAYDDAPVAGSVVGLLRGVPGRVEKVWVVDKCVKVEGLAARRHAAESNGLELLLVTDADDDKAPAELLNANLKL